MKIILSREDKIGLLKAIKQGVWETRCTSRLQAKIKDLPNLDDRIPILTDDDIQKVIRLNDELKKRKGI